MLGRIAIAALGGCAAQLETGEAVDCYYAADEVEMSTLSQSTEIPVAHDDCTIWQSRANWETVDFAFHYRTGSDLVPGHFYYQVVDYKSTPRCNMFTRYAANCFSWDTPESTLLKYGQNFPKNAKHINEASAKKVDIQIGSYHFSTVFRNGTFLPSDGTAEGPRRTQFFQSRSCYLSSVWWRLAKNEKFALFLQPMKSLSGERAVFCEHNKSLIELV